MCAVSIATVTRQLTCTSDHSAHTVADWPPIWTRVLSVSAPGSRALPVIGWKPCCGRSQMRFRAGHVTRPQWAELPGERRMWALLQRGCRLRLRPLLGLLATPTTGRCIAPLSERPEPSRLPVSANRRHFRIEGAPLPGGRMAAEHQEFCSFFQRIAQDLIAEDRGHPEIGDAIARLQKVLEYNAPGGKCNRGVTVLASYRELVGPELQRDGNLQRALAVGWCVELLQAFFLVADDIMDNSVTRRGQPCWYKQSGIGLDAINDAFLLESCIYRLLRKYCRPQPYYLHLLELFLETSYQTELGQALDLITAQPGRVDLDRYTETRYKSIVKYKTAFYSFYLPVAAAMYMAGIDGEEEHANAKTILLEMGEFFQIQDDYLDCFGDPSVTGKIGTDIQDNKCGWLVVEALKRVTPEQRRLLEENYGRDEAEKVQRVKQLYEELDLSTVYRQHEEESFQRLQALVSQHANGLSKEIFLSLARKIYKRQK